tara:strand:+ start:869 stop:1303 length:435 start_codon:yes stop_codon:yes gene_type:complete
MQNNSEKIRNYSITLLSIVATFFLIFYAIYLNNKIKVQQDLVIKVEEIKTELSLNFNKVYDDYKLAIDEQRALQLSIKENAENAGEAFNGMITIFSARLMESENMISRSDADLLVIDSISKIKQSNQTLAELISIINRNWINKR